MSSIQPSREAFHEMAKNHRVIPIWRRVVSDMATPLAAFSRMVKDQERGFLLESVQESEKWSRFSFIGRHSLADFSIQGGEVRITGEKAEVFSHLPKDRGMLNFLDALLKEFKSPSVSGGTPFYDGSFDVGPFYGGIAGYLGYDIVREVENLPDCPSDDQNLPDSILSMVGQVAAFDHWKQQVSLVQNVIIPPSADPAELDALYDEGAAKLDDLLFSGTSGSYEPLFDPPNSDDLLEDFTSSFSPEEYMAAVSAAREHILAGDILQVVLAERFDFDLDCEPLDVYRVLRQINPSPYMYFFNYPDLSCATESGFAIAGTSPEPLVRVRDQKVTSRPIAGTRRRGKTEEEDKQLAAEMTEHPKERAEHTMLVDLARNDLGRVVEYGSLQVEELMTLELYSHVMHMTSQVSGDLRSGLTAADVLRATLPAGTVSGAPKVRAMEIIDEMEPIKRGPYAGIVGYVDFSGNLDMAIAIRTMLIRGNKASITAGAGIVADSIPEEEEKECRNKARALLSAVPAARKMSLDRKKASSPKTSQDAGQ